MAGTLCWEDVSDLSIFKCKICEYRLQYPVMEVQTFGYICGSCYERSPYTNVSKSTDIERILSKLCIPCKYSERGCYFDGTFQKTSEHEKNCTFRDKLCPFSLIGKCEMTGICDVAEHVKKEHEDYIIYATVEEKYVTIEDPMEAKCKETNPDAFYLIEFENKYFLLCNRIDEKQQTCNFCLYQFGNGDNITFRLVAEHESLITKSKKISAISYADILKPCPDSVLTLSSVTLANLGCIKDLKILLDSGKNTNISKSDSILTWYSCTECQLNIIDEAHICTKCKDIQICSSCYEKDIKCSECLALFEKSLNICTLSSTYKIKCEINGCNQFIRKDEYESHRRNCKVKITQCIDSKCNWTGPYMDLSTHLLQTHPSVTSTNKRCISLVSDSISRTCSIIKNNISIKCSFKLTSDERLYIKINTIGPKILGDLYIWELHLNNAETLRSTIISHVSGSFDDDNPEFCVIRSVDGFEYDEVIDVSNYVINNKLNGMVYIKNRDL